MAFKKSRVRSTSGPPNRGIGRTPTSLQAALPLNVRSDTKTENAVLDFVLRRHFVISVIGTLVFLKNLL